MAKLIRTELNLETGLMKAIIEMEDQNVSVMLSERDIIAKAASEGHDNYDNADIAEMVASKCGLSSVLV